MEEVDTFLCMTQYLKMFIPGRAEHARILKEARGGEKKRIGERKGDEGRISGSFQWGPAQQRSFEAIKLGMPASGMTGRRHFLAVDVSTYGFGGVLFQLDSTLCADSTG